MIWVVSVPDEATAQKSPSSLAQHTLRHWTASELERADHVTPDVFSKARQAGLFAELLLAT